jgi:hypothetical protein
MQVMLRIVGVATGARSKGTPAPVRELPTLSPSMQRLPSVRQWMISAFSMVPT